MKKILFLSLVTTAYAVVGSSPLFSGTQDEVNKALQQVRTIITERGLTDEGDRVKILDLGETLVETDKDIVEKIDKYTILKVKAGSGKMKITAPCLCKFTMNYDGEEDVDQDVLEFIQIEE